MNEIALSDDLKTIELEINHHKNIAGQSIWEIGRRLNHVKENDLVHGQFGEWLKHIDFSHTVANQMMKVAKDIPNSVTSQNLGVNVLYLIATLPEEEKQEQLERVEQGESPTTRELQQLKRELRQKDKEMEMLTNSYNEQNELLEEARQQKPKVVTKKVEVIPDDYKDVKNLADTLQEHLNIAKNSEAYYKQKYNESLEERKSDKEKSLKYEQMTETIKQAEGNLNEVQQKIASTKNLLDFVNSSRDFITGMSGLVYQDFENASEFEIDSVDRVIKQVEYLVNDIRKKMNKANILEGEIING